MQNNEQQYTIFIRSTGERIPVSKEEFDNYYRDITRYRQKQQEHGRCVCPRSRCPSKAVPIETLQSEAAAVLGLPEFNEEVFSLEIARIDIPAHNHLVFVFNDGHTVERVWKDRSRSQSWTPEMKEAARQRAIKQRREKKCQEQ